MKKYSFVIPAYNNKTLLRNTLEALNHQKGFGREDYEVVLVDDGSEEPVFDFIRNVNRNYVLKYEYIQRDESSCRSRTRNLGCKLAEGEYIIFIDSDILVREDYLSELERCFSVKRDMAVIGTRLNLKNEISYNSVAEKHVFDEYNFGTAKPDHYEIRHFMFNDMSYNSYSGIPAWLKFFTCNAALPKSWFDKIGGFDENYKGWGMEDIDLGYRLLKEGLRLVINSKLEVLHQNHESLDSADSAALRVNEHHRNIDYFLDKFPDSLDIPRAIVHDLFDGKLKYVPEPADKISEKICITFDDDSMLENIKSDIRKLCERDNVEIVVKDAAESTDLDIWIQLLENPASIPKYYPESRKMGQMPKT